MDTVILVSDFSYTKDVGKLLIKGERKKFIRFYSWTLPLVCTSKSSHTCEQQRNILFHRMRSHLCILQPVHSDAPDVAAVSPISSASAQYQVSRRCVKGHAPELCVPQLGKSIALYKNRATAAQGHHTLITSPLCLWNFNLLQKYLGRNQ